MKIKEYNIFVYVTDSDPLQAVRKY